jgi:hypothetical protein
VRRLVAVYVLAVFAVLAIADGFACPDGCHSASSAPAADRCNASGQCVFCTGAVIARASQVVLKPIADAFRTGDVQDAQAPFPPVTVPDRPPRLT